MALVFNIQSVIGAFAFTGESRCLVACFIYRRKLRVGWFTKELAMIGFKSLARMYLGVRKPTKDHTVRVALPSSHLKDAGLLGTAPKCEIRMLHQATIRILRQLWQTFSGKSAKDAARPEGVSTN